MRKLRRDTSISRQDAVMTLHECEKALKEAPENPLTKEEIDQIIERVVGKGAV